jgi:hypothetical protein
VRKIAVVTQAGPISGRVEVVRVWGFSAGVLFGFNFGSLSGIGVAGYDMVCPVVGAFGKVVVGAVAGPGMAGVGEFIVGALIPGIPGDIIAGVPGGAVIPGWLTYP